MIIIITLNNNFIEKKLSFLKTLIFTFLFSKRYLKDYKSIQLYKIISYYMKTRKIIIHAFIIVLFQVKSLLFEKKI